MAKIMRQRSESIDIRGLLDADTPTGEVLSGIYKRSFAYFTIKDRLPVILTKIIDTLSRDKDIIAQKFSSAAKDEVKSIIGCLSRLKNELVTNKPLKMLKTLPNINIDDANKWNAVLEERTEIEGETPTWFKTTWLYCECYMYRRIYQEIISTKWITAYDPFQKQKCDLFMNSLLHINKLSEIMMSMITTNAKYFSPEQVKVEFIKLLKINLWGNRCDLSLSVSEEFSQSNNSRVELDALDKYLLVDNTNFIWETIKNSNSSTIDFVLDNAAYELFTDFCLAAFLITFKLADKIRFYVKRMPWFVSDVTKEDFHWTIETMEMSDNKYLKAFGHICNTYLKNGSWSIEVESFWTEPYDFAQMQSKDPNLYKKLSEAKFVFFKGDLNYRKLLGDINWEYTTSFVQALRGFHPTNIASLRTLKCDIVVGMSLDLAIKVQEDEPNWLITGKYGIIEAV